MSAVTKELELTPRANAPQALTPVDMLKIAVEKGTDLAQLEKLMDMKERWEANEARKAFVTALNAFKAAPPKVSKTKIVSFKDTKFKHATLDNVCSIVGAGLAEHGISHRWEVAQDAALIKVSCILTHELGHSERVTMQAGADTTGSKNAIQAIGSAVTYLQRYTLLAATGLAATDQDDDGKGVGNGAVITDEQKETIVSLIRETGTNTKNFLAWAEVETVDELPASKFADAVALLSAKKARK